MRRLERGASYVPLIIVVVLLVIAVVWAYVKQDEAAKLQRQVNELKVAAATAKDGETAVKDYLRVHLAPVVGFPFAGTASKYSEYFIDGKAISTFTQGKLKDLESKYKRSFPVSVYTFDDKGGVQLGQAANGNVTVVYYRPGSLPTEVTLEGLYSSMDGAMSRMLNDITRLVKQLDAQEQSAKAQQAHFEATLAQKDQTIAQLRNEKKAVEDQKTASERDLNNQLSQTRDQLAAKDHELSQLKDSTNKQIADLKSENLARQQEVQQAKAIQAAVQAPGPDGQVLAVTDDQGTAILNRGKRDHLKPGTTFDVYSIGKGAVKIHKGVVKVLQVGNTQSQARIHLDNPMNPIVEGDYIESSTYNPKQVLHFYLLGRMQKYGKTEAATRLKQLGQVVDDKVTVHTTYLVMGEPQSPDENLRDTEAYKVAKELGIKIIPEKQLSLFLNY